MSYLDAIPNPSYVTRFRMVCSALGAAQDASAPLADLELARRACAARRDMLVGRQRRRFAAIRQREIDALAHVYDDLLGRILRKTAAVSAAVSG